MAVIRRSRLRPARCRCGRAVARFWGPYAEGYGDVGGRRWAYHPSDNNTPRPETMKLSAADSAAIDKACPAVATCIVSVDSGRPLQIAPAQLARIDALVASWLPDREVEGVSDVVFGTRPFTGKLS